MGAEWFVNSGEGSTVAEAFASAKAQAQYENGHGGYTGTVAEKSNYREIAVPEGMTARDFIHLLEDDDEQEKRGLGWIDDKWGPAAAVRVSEGRWAFFGWASS